MKALPVSYSVEAGKDMDGIYDYILKISENHAVAGGYIDRLYAICESIGSVPFSGSVIIRLGHPVRKRLFERTHHILYEVTPTTVIIHAILSARMDTKFE